MGKKKDKKEKMKAKIAAAVEAALAANKGNAEDVQVKETTSESLSVSGKSGITS